MVSPATTIGLADPEAETAVPVVGVQVAVYTSIGDPPLLDGAENDTVNCPLEATTDKPVGAPGTVAGGEGAVGTVLPGATTDPATLE